MEWEPKNFRHSILPIMVLNWYSGLSVIEYPLGKARPVLTFIYVFIINFVYWFVYCNDGSIETDEDMNDIGKHIFMNIKCLNMFIATCSSLIGWYYYKTIKTNIQRLELLDETLERLGLANNYHETFINSLIKVVMWVVLICILVFFDIRYVLSLVKDLVQSCRSIYLFHCPIHLNSIVAFTFTTIINCIGIRFEHINLLLKRTLLENPAPKSFTKLYPNYNRISTLVMSYEIRTTLRNRQRQMELLIMVRHLHLELSKISCEINKIYQKQMTLEIGSHFATITSTLYNLFTIIFFDNGSLKEKLTSIMSLSLWCASFSYRFLNINSTCARVSSESRKTRDILYELKNSIEDKELKKEYELFSLQLTQRPLVFTGCGFSSLDYTFVQKFIGTVTTLLIIFIQFNPEIRV